MKTNELADLLPGFSTVEIVREKLHVSRPKAIYYIHRLRERGYVKTTRGARGKRLYHISLLNCLGGTSYTETINKYSPVKLATTDVHRIYGKTITPEEALVYAVQSNSIRKVAASLALFRKITDWKQLYHMAREQGAWRKIGAMYELARLKLPKIRRMPKRFFNLALPKQGERFIYIVEPYVSKNFKEIEGRWKVYIPLNKADLEDYA